MSRYAIQRYFVGDTDLSGNPSPTGWKDIGLDLDGLSSDKNLTCHCKSVSKMATADIRTDGTNGIDNSFGNIIIAQATLPIDNASKLATAGIEGGGDTFVLAFSDLGSAPNYASVKAQLIPVRMLDGKTPKFDETDAWSPFSGSTMQPVTYDGGWVNADTWVSAPSSTTLNVTLRLFDVPWSFPVRRARVVAKLSQDRTRIERGTIGGAMGTEEFVDSLRALSAKLNLCGAAFESVAGQIRQAADNPSSGTHDSNVLCDEISIGLGFTARRTGPLGAAAAPPPPPGSCADQ